MGARLKLAGRRFDRLVVIGLADMRSGRSIWHCKCDCGATLEVLGTSLQTGNTRSCGCLHRERVQESRTAKPSYGAIHTRLAVARGSARTHACVDCGGSADQWSYDHDDPDEMISSLGHPYSGDLDHYLPRCCSCHRAFDAAHGGR